MPGDGIEERFVDTRRFRLRAVARRVPGGAQRPPLLLFNGIGANAELALPFLKALERTDAVVFDAPGCGLSPTSRWPYRPRHLAQAAVEVMDAFGFDGQVDAAGVSWGGAMAQQCARQFPDRCRRLVLASTSPGFVMVPARPRILLKMATARRYMKRGEMQKLAGELYGGAFRTDPKLAVSHAAALRGGSRLGYLHQLACMAGWSSLPWLGRLTQRTLVMAGTDDPLVPMVNARMLVRLIPDVRLVTLDDGHLFMLTRPQEAARIVEAFLA
ncbi:MAG: poly(3-hydroxyalkanoate) depolymerase [Rhizobiaceae bacterium]|nr:poly(3-hydroxyalkanoate) depolymerase [Rhizobiaceae bacterium]